MPFPSFDRSRLRIKPLAERLHDLDLTTLLALMRHCLRSRMLRSRRSRSVFMTRSAGGAARIALMGAHVLRTGVSRQLIDMMERGDLTHLAMNGAGPIHDWELALIGATTESVARYIQTGEFGLWHETGRINDAIVQGAKAGLGLGESIGRAILDGTFPHKDVSVLAAAVRLNVPLTVHVGVGYDIIHEHPNCDGAALGKTSYEDFLIFTQSVANLENGVLLSLGSAVMGPEVYLKTLSMARNVAHQDSRTIRNFTTGVFDLIAIDDDHRTQAPKSDPRYYYRPWKTILVRTVADGGESFYIQGDHRLTVPHLHRAIRALE